MKHILSKFGHIVKSRQYELFLGSCVILVAVISYNLGQINSLKKTPIGVKESVNTKAEIFDAVSPKFETLNSKQTQSSKSQIQKLDARVVVSKNSDKYHYSWCSGAKRIKPENQIWFDNESLAQKAGYTLAGNCN